MLNVKLSRFHIYIISNVGFPHTILVLSSNLMNVALRDDNHLAFYVIHILLDPYGIQKGTNCVIDHFRNFLTKKLKVVLFHIYAWKQ